jgi:hypothetical protein
MRILFFATLLSSAHSIARGANNRHHIQRRAAILLPMLGTPPASAESGNVGTAAERLARSGANAKVNDADSRCSSGVFLNFRPGTCSPVGNLYDAAAKKAPAAEQESMDDLATSFMKKSAKPAEAEASSAQPAARSAPAAMMAKDPEEFQPPGVFSAKNAGPFAILIIVGVFQGLLPIRDSLPVWLQDLIPVVLGRQAAPPGYIPPEWFFWY